MELKNGYKVIYDKAVNGEHVFYASKTGVFADAEEISRVAAGQYKLIYEKDGQFFGSVSGIPAEDDHCFTEFNRVFKHALSEPQVFENGEFEVLLDKADVRTSGYDGAIEIKGGATVTIDGDGVVEGKLDRNYAMAVYAHNNTDEDPAKVIIKNGTFVNEGDGTDQMDMIYASGSSIIEIEGGSFKCATPRWTLNKKNDSDAQIIVRGGEFFEFNPAALQTDDDASYVADGYQSAEEIRADGAWYVVSKAPIVE